MGDNNIKRVVDMSYADVQQIARVLGICDQAKLKTNPLAHLLNETRDFWAYWVRSTADVFVSKEKA
jgi:hypothetical protein